MMRILTVRQPWAWAIIHGGKDVENRVRNLAGDYHGPLAIHAGLAFPDMRDLKAVAERVGRPARDRVDEPRGAIIGVVKLVDVHDAEWMPEDVISPRAWMCSRWAERAGKHLVLANPRPLRDPIPYRGALHLQTASDELEAEILRRTA